jgi:hypothetical protein
MRFLVPVIWLILLAGIPVSAQTQTEVIQDNATVLDLRPFIDVSTASILIGEELNLINTTICSGGTSKCNVKSKDFYVLIHILVWSDTSKGDASKDVSPKAQNWYVYHAGSLSPYTEAKRLYGTRTMYFLYVHLNVPNPVTVGTPYTGYTPRYELQITKTTPTNVQDLFELATLAGSSGNTQFMTTTTPPVPVIWGGRQIEIRYVPSTIQIDSRYVTGPDSPRGNELSAVQTFSNEGKYWWDVSVGIPVKRISDLSFNSTNNTATTSQTSTTNAFALLDLYYPRVDLSGTTYSYVPHPIVGVAMAGQPLHKILVGGAVGLHFAEFYAGVLFVKQQSLSGLQVGSPATPAQLSAASHFNFKPQFTVGINIPIRTALQQLKKIQSKSP